MSRRNAPVPGLRRHTDRSCRRWHRVTLASVSLLFVALFESLASNVSALDGAVDPHGKNHVRELLQSPVTDDTGSDSIDPSKTFPFFVDVSPQPRCGDNCATCDGYGQCTTCKEGYVPTPGSGGVLACTCIDSDCASCPDAPDRCTICKDLMAEPDDSGACVCKEGYAFDEEAAMCVDQNLISVPPRLPESPSIEPPSIEPPSIEPPAIEPAPIAEPTPEPSPGQEPPLDPQAPVMFPDPPVCQDSLCAFCLDVAVCEQCVENATADDKSPFRTCACNDRFKMKEDGGVAACVEDKKDTTDDDDNTDISNRPPQPTTPNNGLADLNRPSTGGGSGASGPVGPSTTVTPILREKIKELADKHGIALGDKVQSLLDKHEDVSDAVADMLAEKGDAAAEVYNSLVALKAEAASNAASDASTHDIGGFQYTNIRLESVTPEGFVEASENDVANLLSLSDQQSAASAANADEGPFSNRASDKLKDWLKNKLKKDDQQPSVPAGGQPTYVSGFAGSEQIDQNQAMMIELLRQVDQEMEALQSRAHRGTDDRKAELLAMLASVDEEIERRHG